MCLRSKATDGTSRPETAPTFAVRTSGSGDIRWIAKTEVDMLESLRKAAGTWVAKILLLLLVGSFAVWGISGQIGTGYGANTVITAGGTTVSITDYRLAYDRQINILSQRFGQRITREMAVALGVDEQVLAQLVSDAVLDEQARLLRLGHSKERLAELARNDPAFAGPDGKFDRQRFEFVLQQVGMTPEDYLRNRQQEAIRLQIIEGASDGMRVPDTFLTGVALYRGEDRTVEYVALPKALVEPIADPAADVLSAWFEENKNSYGAPEYRKIAYVRLEAQDIADTSSITDEQVRQDYEKNIARYTTPETRTIEQIVFKSPEAAKAAADSIRAGSTFDDIVKAEGRKPEDVLLGTFTKDKVPDPAIADAAFALQANQVSDVINGSFGPVLIRVTEITPEVVKPYDQVADQIRNDLALAEANRILLDVHDQYEDERAGGSTLRQAAEKLKLEVKSVEAIDRTARTPDGTIVNDLPESERLIAALFESEVNVENPSLPTAGGGFVFYEVEGITPARERPLEEVRDKVLADWKAAEATRLLVAKATDLEKQLKDGGTTLDAIATQLSLEKQTKRGVKRDADDADIGRDGVAAIFAQALNGTGYFATPENDGQIVFKVTEVFEPVGAGPDTLPEEERQQFTAGLASDLINQLVAELQVKYGVTVNRSAIAQALSF
jgi:peptidyl-prolyl cis-trans isomerase D